MPKKDHQILPPGPHKNIYFGSTFDFRYRMLPTLVENWRKYGDVVCFRFGGNSSMYLLAHPSHAKHVLQERAQIYHKQSWSSERWKELVGESLTTTDGSVWLHRRRLLQPSLHRKSLTTLGEVITNTTREMLTNWDQAVMRNKLIDIYEEMCRLTLNITTRALFGTDLPKDINVFYTELGIGVKHMMFRSQSYRVLPLNPFSLSHRRFLAARGKIDTIIFRIIEQQRHSSNSVPNLLSQLLDTRDEETGEGLNDQQLRDEVLSTITAGYLTTAVTLTWAWIVLSIHPYVRSWLETELYTILGDRTPNIDDLVSLQCTEKLVKETLRLYPAAWMIPRVTIEDDYLPPINGNGGYRIPSGKTVLLSPYITHRHPAYWDNPEGFDPERFSSERKSARLRYAYFPFGGGARQCIGNNFAMMEMQLILAAIAQRYRLNLLPGYSITLQKDASIEFAHEMPMSIVPIQVT